VETLSLVIRTGTNSHFVQPKRADRQVSASKRYASASYSGAGGNASGGSVKNHCSRHREVSRTLADSETSKHSFTGSRSGSSLFALRRNFGASSSTLIFSLFQPNSCQDDMPTAYLGVGEDASGGSIKGGHGLIDIWSCESSSLFISRFKLSLTIKGMVATVAMPARDMLIHIALEQKHILV
jgi:hypothetical protein